MGSGVHCKQCGKELEGMDQYSYPYMCSACRHAEEVRKQGEEAREWRQRQEWEDMERAREQRKHEREQRQWEEEQAEKDRKLRERELKDQEQRRKLAEEQRHEEISYNKALPKCKWCGKQYTFAPDSNSFYEYCSKKCAIEELGKDKADEYASGGLQLIMQQISNAFACEKAFAITVSNCDFEISEYARVFGV